MNHPAETEPRHLHARAGVPDVRDGVPRRARAHGGRTPARISELWARFSDVAAGNPYAWIRDAEVAGGDHAPSPPTTG